LSNNILFNHCATSFLTRSEDYTFNVVKVSRSARFARQIAFETPTPVTE
jgi:hypothetical protein